MAPQKTTFALATLLASTPLLSAKQEAVATPEKQTTKTEQKKTTRAKKHLEKKENKKCEPQKTTPAPTQKNMTTPTTEPKKQASAQRSIKITRDINDTMLAYRYGFITYSPSSFKMNINGQPIETKETLTVPVTDNKIAVRYDYEFLGGKRKGSREVTFEVPATINDLTIHFSWHDEYHVLIDKATPKSIVTL